MSSIEQTLKRLERKIDLLTQARNKERWVKISVIKEATGWTVRDVRRFRENGLIQFRREKGVIEYNLHSIPEQFLKHQ